jgi:hypothetical protein
MSKVPLKIWKCGVSAANLAQRVRLIDYEISVRRFQTGHFSTHNNGSVRENKKESSLT